MSWGWTCYTAWAKSIYWTYTCISIPNICWCWADTCIIYPLSWCWTCLTVWSKSTSWACAFLSIPGSTCWALTFSINNLSWFWATITDVELSVPDISCLTCNTFLSDWIPVFRGSTFHTELSCNIVSLWTTIFICVVTQVICWKSLFMGL